MARSVSDEERQLRKRARRRLIGAIVAVTAVVVALPMVLDSEPKPVSQDIDIRIPSPESSAPFASKVVPLPDAGSASKPAPAAKPEPGPAAAGKQTQAPAPAPPPAAAKPQPPREAAKSGKTASAPGGAFVVQVVALSDAQKAKQIEQQIGAAGIKSYTEVVKTARGDVTRVRAGPFATREAAEKAQQQLKGIGFDGKVIPGK